MHCNRSIGKKYREEVLGIKYWGLGIKYWSLAKAENYKRVPLDLRKEEYDALKEQAESVPMNTFIKKALNSYTGQEIFKV